jgi:hypothetical protein
MKFLYSIIHVLNKPFPEQESAYGMLRISTIISAFVTFFLYIFQPFGISAIESNTFLICLGSQRGIGAMDIRKMDLVQPWCHANY